MRNIELYHNNVVSMTTRNHKREINPTQWNEMQRRHRRQRAVDHDAAKVIREYSIFFFRFLLVFKFIGFILVCFVCCCFCSLIWVGSFWIFRYSAPLCVPCGNDGSSDGKFVRYPRRFYVLHRGRVRSAVVGLTSSFKWIVLSCSIVR